MNFPPVFPSEAAIYIARQSIGRSCACKTAIRGSRINHTGRGYGGGFRQAIIIKPRSQTRSGYYNLSAKNIVITGVVLLHTGGGALQILQVAFTIDEQISIMLTNMNPTTAGAYAIEWIGVVGIRSVRVTFIM